MRIFHDQTVVDVPGLESYQCPRIETEVIRYRPESWNDELPTILYTKTEVRKNIDSPRFVYDVLEKAVKRGRIKDVIEEAVVLWYEVDAAKVIREAIKRHDETVLLARDILTAAAGRKEKEE